MNFKSFYNWPSFSDKEMNAVKNILKSRKINSLINPRGECYKLEKEFSNYIGNKYSLALSNGTIALELALKTIGVKKNDEVIVTPRSFIASASCVLNVGAIPVFADIGEDNLLSPREIEKNITRNTKAIMPTQLNGRCCDMDKINQIAKDNNLKLFALI